MHAKEKTARLRVLINRDKVLIAMHTPAVVHSRIMQQAIARYRAAVYLKNELDPNFVILAQCYARDAAGGSLEDTIARLKAYEEEAGVDWVQLESPHSVH